MIPSEFTPRQTVLMDRIAHLCEVAGQADFFPLQMLEIKGGGSLFRLEPNPNDADLSILYAQSTTEASKAFNAFFVEFEDFSFKHEYDLTPMKLLPKFLKTSTGRASRKYERVFGRWLEAASWPAFEKALQHTWLRDDQFGWTSKPICPALSQVITKRMIASRWPRLQIVALAQQDWEDMKMKMTTIWTTSQTFDADVILAASSQHIAEDGASLLPDFRRETKVSQILADAIALATMTPERDSRDWPEAICDLRNQAYKLSSKSEQDHSPVDMSVLELRKSLKKQRKYIEFQEAILREIMLYKCGPYLRTWMRDSRHRSLEQYLATDMFGGMGKARTRSWLKWAIELGFDIASLVHTEQLRLKGRSEVLDSLLH